MEENGFIIVSVCVCVCVCVRVCVCVGIHAYNFYVSVGLVTSDHGNAIQVQEYSMLFKSLVTKFNSF